MTSPDSNAALLAPNTGAAEQRPDLVAAGQKRLSWLERSIIGFGARIGPRALIRDGVIGDGAHIGARCELLRGARVWPGVNIPDGGIRYSTDV